MAKRNKNPTAVTLIYILLSLFSISILMFERCIFEAGMASPWLLRYVRCIFISLLSQRHFATTANVLHNGTKSFLKKQTFSEVGAVYCPSHKRHAFFWNEMPFHILITLLPTAFVVGRVFVLFNTVKQSEKFFLK